MKIYTSVISSFEGRWLWSLLKVQVKGSQLWSNKWAVLEWRRRHSSVSADLWLSVSCFAPWSCFCLIVFLSWGNSGALACSIPDLCLLVIHFHQLKLPWVKWSATCSLLRCPTAQLDNRLSLMMLSKSRLLIYLSEYFDTADKSCIKYV